jgi:hypothetical protein
MKKQPARRESRLLTTDALAAAKGGSWYNLDFDVDVSSIYTYEKIDWEWQEPGGGATDNWESTPYPR